MWSRVISSVICGENKFIDQVLIQIFIVIKPKQLASVRITIWRRWPAKRASFERVHGYTRLYPPNQICFVCINCQIENVTTELKKISCQFSTEDVYIAQSGRSCQQFFHCNLLWGSPQTVPSICKLKGFDRKTASYVVWCPSRDRYYQRSS